MALSPLRYLPLLRRAKQQEEEPAPGQLPKRYNHRWQFRWLLQFEKQGKKYKHQSRANRKERK